jgi:DNA-binding beta-propeller fold protein YncE
VEGTVSRIDLQSNSVVDTIHVASPISPATSVAAGVVSIVASPDAVWVTAYQDNLLVRIDPQTNTVVARLSPDTLTPEMQGPIGVSVGAGSVWLCEHLDSASGLSRVSPQSTSLQQQIVLNTPGDWVSLCSGVVALDQAIWVLTAKDMGTAEDVVNSVSLIHIDPSTNTVIARIKVRADPFNFAADSHGVWVLSPNQHVSRIDPLTNRVLGSIALPDPAGVAIGAGAVWIADRHAGVLYRIAPTP